MGKLFMTLVLCLAMAGPALAQSTSKSKAAGSSATSLKSDQFGTEAAAKSHCPGDTVVWATNSKAHAYHLTGDRYYGKTRHGAYMCQKDADRAGLHQAGRRTAAGSSAKKSTSTH